jgi:uncharacterized membrane protein YkvA (DUF1232 family)
MSTGQLLIASAGIAVVGYAAFFMWLLAVGRRKDAHALAGFIPDCLVLFRRLLGDETVPRRRKLLLAALIGYLALPFDLVPDFIPVAGQLDDVIVVSLVLRAVLRSGGPDLLREHWPGPAASLNALIRLAYGRGDRGGRRGRHQCDDDRDRHRTVGMDVTVEGEHIDHAASLARIEQTGAVVHSVDQAGVGERLIERVVRAR